MRWMLSTAIVLLLATPGAGAEPLPLPSRELFLAPIGLQEPPPRNFDLIDFRAEQRLNATRRTDAEPHSIFVIKQHVGTAAGYDAGVAHGSIGFYLTVAEWGRWNFGVPSVALGFGHYRVFDPRRQQSVVKNESTVIVSLASVHYRVGYLRSVGANWYINLEQIYDMRHNIAGSQFGLSFSTK